MSDKDMSEKTLFDYNDVFADIVNLYFALSGINRRVKPEELQNIRSRSIYKFGDDLHEQERDIVKLWKPEGIAICLIGLENQTDIDPDMPLRIFGYEGADYRGQLTDKENAPYFVLTIVLYYGTERRWTAPKNLFDRLNVPQEFRPFVNDCRVNVVELAWLTDEQAKMLGNDAYVVIDYLRQVRTKKHYDVPEEAEIKHVDELLKLLYAMTKEHKFEKVRQTLPEGENTMKYVKSFFEIEREAGRAEGLAEGLAKEIANLKEIAQRLLAEGMPPEKVAAITNLSDFSK
ncbi:MAG: Rpn family recombination-promoting nuclease/putative transposase [Synergistaceae bacterium]|nr:Rpn family recombination-promoting nuclease/putative transposase [Synergistaceae bacterium]